MQNNLSKQELRKNWVKELRTDNNRQGYNKLLNWDNGYCCLGVAGKLIGLSDELLSSSYHDRLPNQEDPYNTIQRSYGLQSGLGEFDGEIKGCGNLANLNDSGYSFKEIADIIESNPPGLFVEEEVDG